MKDLQCGASSIVKWVSAKHKTLEAPTQTKPKDVTQWSIHKIPANLGASGAMVQRFQTTSDLQPDRARTFKLSKDWKFLKKLFHVVVFYLTLLEYMLVLYVDEKSQITGFGLFNREFTKASSPP